MQSTCHEEHTTKICTSTENHKQQQANVGNVNSRVQRSRCTDSQHTGIVKVDLSSTEEQMYRQSTHWDSKSGLEEYRGADVPTVNTLG